MWIKGFKHTEESKMKMSIAHIGKKHSEETKKKISLAEKGRPSPNWKGGRVKTSGYVRIHQPCHPFAIKTGYVLEHRLVMEKRIGRYLTPVEEVHHENEIKDDNRDENLTLFANGIEHRRFHRLKKNNGVVKNGK